MEDYHIEVSVQEAKFNLFKVVDFYVIYQPSRWSLDRFNMLMQVIETQPYTPRVEWGGIIAKVVWVGDTNV
jgi:hypothetical protein